MDIGIPITSDVKSLNQRLCTFLQTPTKKLSKRVLQATAVAILALSSIQAFGADQPELEANQANQDRIVQAFAAAFGEEDSKAILTESEKRRTVAVGDDGCLYLVVSDPDGGAVAIAPASTHHP